LIDSIVTKAFCSEGNSVLIRLLIATCTCVATFHSIAWADETESGFVRLFNGADLTGWEGLEGAWTVTDGAIKCTGNKKGERNWLIWRGGELADFELRLKFRFTSGNSGVQVRSKDQGDFQVRGYQVEIASAEKMGLWHHSLSPEPYRSHLATAGQNGRVSASGEKTHVQFAAAAEIQKACHDGQWNELVIIAKGSKLVQTINGVVFAELVDEDAKYAAKTGVLAFQDHGKGTVAEFKDILLKKK
jgi:hypothetical protein